MAILKVGPSASSLADIVPDPASMTWGLQDISASDAGRVQDPGNTMYKMRTSQKRKVSLSWTFLAPSQVAQVLQAFDAEYFFVRYLDALSGSYEVREFYRGDVSAPVQWVSVPGKGDLFASVSFDIIER